ncbi:CBS domain-containing protein [Salinicola avicenniae]|uniref:CBS domain-containing protein n=1 Tax=Salinicola avicenniae TaxID=2916836 RepID=UPI0020743AAF|nr:MULTISPECIES: CBS domain-containing protein [unclassified Salinicola]
MTIANPATVADIMSRDVVTLHLAQTLHDGNELMRQHRIRHIPVVDDDGRMVGLLDQKVALREAMRIADDYGTQRLEHHLRQVPLAQAMRPDFIALAAETPLADAGRKLLAHRQGAMPVLAGEHLVGILSSVDFVRLAITLLER